MPICCMCKEEKAEKEFSWKFKTKKIRHNSCKQCHRTYSKQHYYSNTKAYIDRAVVNNKVTLEKRRKVIIDYLQNHPCIDCNESDIVVLDFDHRDNKLFSIAARYHSVSIKRLMDEIAKCDVRCSNCHRRKTAAENGFYRIKVPGGRFELTTV